MTTLRKRDVKVRGQRLTFTFRAKHGALNRTTLVDPELAAAVKTMIELPGGSGSSGSSRTAPVDLTGAMLNAYLAEHLGEGFTAKDFRTWGGSLRPRSRSPSTGRPSRTRRQEDNCGGDASRRQGAREHAGRARSSPT